MPPITEKTTKATPQRSSSKNTFFRKPGEGFFDRSGETFFGPKEHNSFFAPPVQPKLSVNAPDDAYEKEADATADKVMRTTDKTTAAPPPGNKEEERVDRKEDTVKEELQRSHETPSAPPVTGKEEERIDKKEDANAKEELQRMHETPPATGTEDEDVQRKGDGTPDVTPSFEQGLQNTKGSGNPLPDNTRQHMESGIGADFSSVRVHTGSQASQLSNSIQAQAFTHGSDIYFNEGKYSPGTDSGKHLLAHELTHTVQQGASAPAVSRKEDEEAGKDTKKEPVQENNVATDTRVQPAAGTETTTGSPAANTPAAEEKDKKETAGTEKEAPGKVAETGAQSSGTDGNAAADDTGASTPGTTDTQGQVGTAAPETTEEEQGDKPAAGQQTSAAPGDAPAENKPAIEKAPTNPADDAGFQAVLDGVKTTATEKAKHPEAGAKEKEIGLAANGGAGEVDGLAKAKQVNKIGEKQPKPFDKAAFKAALMVKIKEVTPKNLEQADEFKKKNKAGSIKPALTQQVKSSEDKAQGDIKNTTAQQPSAAGIKPKEVKPLKDMPAGKVPQLDGKGAAPKPKTEAEVTQDAKDQSKSLDDAYAQDGVTSDQLQQSKEPEFVAADNKKKESQQNISDSTTTYRKDETAMLSHANAEAGGMVNKGLGGMHGARTGKFAAAMGRQKDGKGKDEAARAKVTADLKQIYTGTKTAVERKLQQLDVTVNTIFDAGAAKSKQLFEDYVDRKMTAYKDKRYSGWLVGTGRWIKDKFMGLPDEVNAFYTEGRELYVKYMDTVLDIIASKVETELTAATRLVADGKKQVNDYIDKQPESLKAIAKQEGKKIMTDFSSLEQSIADKQTALIDSLAKKYTEKLEAVDKRITEMKEANKGWVAMAMDMVGSILKTIRDLKNTLLNVLNKAIEIIGAIIMHPIDFLGNLVEAVGNGIKNFAGNIWEHLKNGVFEWLMGNMPGGIEFPKTWDLKGIFYFVMQLLGLTWPAIRARAVKLLGNEKLVKKLEGAFDIFMVIRDEGLPGLWRYIQEQVGNLQTLVIDAIMSMLQTQIVEAGIKWLLGLLTPAGAFIKACMAIIDIVKWFINNAQRILDLINSIFDSISDIVAGNLTAASGKVEQALKKIIPITLGFLASLLGIGDLATRVQDIIKRITAPINKAIDWVMDKAMEFAKKTFGKLTGKGEDKKGKVGEDDDNVKGKTKVDTQIGEKMSFTAGKEGHSLWIELQGGAPVVMVASVKDQLVSKLTKWSKTDKGKSDEVAPLIAEAQRKLAEVNKDALQEKKVQDNLGHASENGAVDKLKKLETETEKDEQSLISVLQKLFVIFDEDHPFYQIQNVKERIEGDTFVLNYDYKSEANDKSPGITVKMKIADIAKRMVEQSVVGQNLAIKDKGLRGNTVSAGELTKGGYGTTVPQLNSAHVLADWFQGTGYRNGLNLIATSATYNQKIMGDAEKDIVKKIRTVENRNKEKFVTFDLQVVAQWKAAKADNIIDTLKTIRSDMKPEELKDLHVKLAEKQDPRRCESVTYEVLNVYIDGMKNESVVIDKTTIGADTYLNENL